MPINPENESSYLFDIIRSFGGSSTEQEQIVHIPCKHPGGERKSKGKATNYRHRLYTIAKWLRTHSTERDRIVADQFRTNWKLTLEPDPSNSFWYIVLTPASLDPERQMVEEMWASAMQQLQGTDPRKVREAELSSLAELEPDTGDKPSVSSPISGDSNQLFRSLYGLNSDGTEPSASRPAPTPDPTTLSDAELRAEIEAYLAADSAIPPELDAEMKRRGG